MFQVDVNDLINNKFQLMVQDTRTQTNVIDTWFYWEYELYIKLLNKKNKDDKENSDSQESKNPTPNMSNFNPSKMLGNLGSGMPKIPKF